MTVKTCADDIRKIWSEFNKGEIGPAQAINDIDGCVGGVKTFKYIPGRNITIYGKDDACGITLNGEEGTGTFRNLIYLMRQLKNKKKKDYWM